MSIIGEKKPSQAFISASDFSTLAESQQERGEDHFEAGFRSLTPEASRSAALPSFPFSFIIFKPSIEMTSAVPLASTLNSQDIAQLQAALQGHQCQIRSLILKFEDTQNEVQSLRKERRKAFKQHLRAVCGNSEEEIEKHKRKEERLMKMMKEREQIIEGLDKRIEEGREHERERKGKLAEAEGRAEEMKKRLREAKSGVRGGGRAGEKAKGNGKDKGICEKRGGDAKTIIESLSSGLYLGWVHHLNSERLDYSKIALRLPIRPTSHCELMCRDDWSCEAVTETDSGLEMVVHEYTPSTEDSIKEKVSDNTNIMGATFAQTNGTHILAVDIEDQEEYQAASTSLSECLLFIPREQHTLPLLQNFRGVVTP
jgi:hypothetical protein